MHGVLSVQSYWERCSKSGLLFIQRKVLSHNGAFRRPRFFIIDPLANPARMLVLLVEDDAVLADGLIRTLQGHGMQVEPARDGIQADLLLQQHPVFAPAVAVLDIGLPGIDGFEVVRRLRARDDTTPVLLLTARDAVEDRVRGLETGADFYWTKPFIPADLARLVKIILQEQEQAKGAGVYYLLARAAGKADAPGGLSLAREQ